MGSQAARPKASDLVPHDNFSHGLPDGRAELAGKELGNVFGVHPARMRACQVSERVVGDENMSLEIAQGGGSGEGLEKRLPIHVDPCTELFHSYWHSSLLRTAMATPWGRLVRLMEDLPGSAPRTSPFIIGPFIPFFM